MILHLGVNDVPYMQNPSANPSRPKAPGTQTTGDVAEWLEAKYHIMETFADRHMDEIAAALEKSVAGSLENLMMGAPPRNNPFGEAESQIEADFNSFLDMKEMDAAGAAGVPTAASLRGVNHRLKIRRGAPRPSFIDTGLYEASFRAWVE